MTSEALLKQAQAHCSKHNLQLTTPRRQVLSIIAGSKKPLGAYDILEKLGKHIKDPKPPTVYRALKFLQEQGFVHCIESLNAYVTCGAGHLHHGSQFMICRKCGTVTEMHLCSMPEDFSKKIKSKKFKAEGWNLEVHGLCSTCQ